MKEAYKKSDGRKIDGRRVVVDVERGNNFFSTFLTPPPRIIPNLTPGCNLYITPSNTAPYNRPNCAQMAAPALRRRAREHA
jgi:hypothetical protein